MADQEWLRPTLPVEAAWSASTPRPGGGFELRPLSLGEVLDRTFALYRSRFWLFAGISMISATVHVISQGISLSAASKFAQHLFVPPGPGGKPTINLHAFGVAQFSGWLVALIFFLVSAVTQAATAFALAEVYLQRPVSVKSALGVVGRRWARWIAIALWQAWSAAWVMICALIPAILLLGFGTRSGNTGLSVIGGVLLTLAILGGGPVGVVLYLRNALAIPAAVTEGLGIRASIRRSKVLAAGTKGRIFVVLLIAGCLFEVVGVLQSPAAILIVLAPNKQHYLAQAITLLIAFIGHTVVAPVASIGLALVYFDQRVRKEAFDLVLLLEGTHGGSGLPLNSTPPVPLPPEGYAPLG